MKWFRKWRCRRECGTGWLSVQLNLFNTEQQRVVCRKCGTVHEHRRKH